MFQGGHHPDYGVEYYEEHFAAIKAAFPQLVIHSLGASEVDHMARISGVSAEEGDPPDPRGRPGLLRRRRRGAAARAAP